MLCIVWETDNYIPQVFFQITYPCPTPSVSFTDLCKRGPGFNFLYDLLLIWLWIKSISNELDITFQVLKSQLSGLCDVISNWLWHHQQNVNWVSETWRGGVKIIIFIIIYGLDCCVRNEIMYVVSWWLVYTPTRVLFWCLFPLLLHNCTK